MCESRNGTSENTQTNSNKTVSAQPIVEKEILLKPVAPNVRFNAKRQKYLNEALPPKVREILEKAEKFEILAEVNNDPDGLDFEPNRVAVITDENEKKEVLETFYFDASEGDYPSACYIPHHKIRAVYQGKTVEIEICFECSKFYVESPFGKYDGGIIRENRKRF
ncbi:MAG TPA: hypothetical protein VNB22_22465 [Pyrinomonadaceae bacterium]|nr:hypothetical protein [Pyrinomonadaceae bacterium]